MRLIDGEALLNQIDEKLKSMRNVAAYSYSSGIYHGYQTLYNEINNGNFDIPSNQGESRLREALIEVKRMVLESKGRIWTGVGICDVVNNVLSSSHTEDTGIQKVREYWISLENSGTSYDIDQMHGVRITLKYLGITIPGITDGGDNNA